MSETYDVVGWSLSKLAVVVGLSAFLTGVSGRPNERMKAKGYSMACVPVTMEAMAKVKLTILKVGRKRLMVHRDEGYLVGSLISSTLEGKMSLTTLEDIRHYGIHLQRVWSL